jgi:hypothetical protein
VIYSDDASDDAFREDQRAIESLAGVEYMTATNEGTYGSAECFRKIGCGDPAFGNRYTYETVGGEKREKGPDADYAPGYMRTLNRDALSADRSRLSRMRSELATAMRRARR